MPTFDFTSPDGKSYSVDGPEGATPEQAFQILQQHLGAPSEGSSIGGVAKSLGTGLAEGAIGLAGIPGDLAALNMKLAGREASPGMGSADIKKRIEQYTGEFYKPQGTAEEIASKVGQFAPAVLGGPETLAARVATRAVAPAVASEIGGKVAGPYGELAGALVGAGGATAAARKFQEMAAARRTAGTLPSGEDLIRKGSDQFDQARNMDLTVKPDFAKRTAQDMRAAVENYDPEQIKPVLNAINRVDELYQPAKPNLYNALNTDRAAVPVPMNQVELARKQLSSLRTSPDASLRSAAKAAQEAITKNQMALVTADSLSGDASLYAKTLQEAVGNYGAGKRSNTITGKIDLGNLNAATAGSGANEDNALRQAFKQLARPINNTNTPKWQRLGFNGAEGAAIEQAARGTTTGNIARYLGKGAPTGIVSAAGGLGIGHMAGGPIGAVALPAAGYIAKKIGDLSTKRAVAAVDSLVRSRSPLAAQVAAQLSPQIIQQMPAKSQRILQNLSTAQAPSNPTPIPAARAPVPASPPAPAAPVPRITIPPQAAPIFAPPKIVPPAATQKLPSQVSVGPANFKTTPRVGEGLWHETSPDSAARLLEDDMTNSVDKMRLSNIFVTNNKDIAIGQAGKGVKIEFDGSQVSAIEHKKPGTGDLAGREYRANAIGNNAIKSIEVAPGETLPMRPSWQRRLDSDFNKSVLGDGTIRYLRKP